LERIKTESYARMKGGSQQCYVYRSLSILFPKRRRGGLFILSLRGEKADGQLLGETDVFVRMKRREIRPEYIVGLKNIPLWTTCDMVSARV